MATTMKAGEQRAEPMMSRGQLAALEEADRVAEREDQRVQAVLHPAWGAPAPSEHEILSALQVEGSVKAAALAARIKLKDGQAAFAEGQRARRAEVVARLDAEVARELAVLIEVTDRVAAQHQAFAEANRRRDEAYLATGVPGEFGVARYADRVFAPLVAAAPGELSAWAAFKARVAEPSR